ncbi:MAG: hypothetical protein ACRESZ_16055 [Methylococcales bacterium]
MNRSPNRFPFPDHLPPEAALALFDCLTGLVEAVWQHYEPILLDQIIPDLDVSPDDEFESDFDDETPFWFPFTS